MPSEPSREWVVQALARHEGPLLRYARRLLGDVEAARDVVQDCFLRLCRERREEVEGHLAPWLFTVCRRRAIDHLRKEGRMHPLESARLPETAHEGAPEAEPMEVREETDRVLACVRRLPERQQEVVRLRFQAGLSYREISEVTGASVGNVGFLLHTALRSLRHHLGVPVAPRGERTA